jgi:hypothetical protein
MRDYKIIKGRSTVSRTAIVAIVYLFVSAVSHANQPESPPPVGPCVVNQVKDSLEKPAGISEQLSQPGSRQVSSIIRVPFDHVDWNASTGRTSLLTLDVPPDAVSFTVYAYSDNKNEFYLVDSVTNPKGEIFVSEKPANGKDDHFGSGPSQSPNKSQLGTFAGFNSLLVPNNPTLHMTPGQWRFSVRAVQPDLTPTKAAPKILVLIKTKSGGPITDKTKGNLNINLQFTGSDDWTAKTAANNSQLQQMIQKLKSIYSEIGVEISVKKQVDTRFPGQIADIRDQKTLDLFKQGVGSDGINVIFVHRIMVDQANTAQGFSGALLGPVGIASAPQNAVLVITEPINPLMRKPPTANVLAHEIGHYLGLPHTYDGNPHLEHDPFTDTSKEQFGSTNLMQPGMDDDVSSVSPQQRHAILLSPAVTLFE